MVSDMKTTSIPEVSGLYRQRATKTQIAISLIGHIAIGAILAYAAVGMTGALDEEKPLVLSCIHCTGDK